ncbi:MAG TPA: type II secretion system protein [Candidatus Omnitrophota bacterium]|nr:type II secretion system protein [Candidatus Omnitrophota bacterium]HPN88414.1 type II secretion system protein [Candidatus Omnitrophota bacterium]
MKNLRSIDPVQTFFSHRRLYHGFTLVEMVITIAILSIGLVAILRSFLNMSFVLYAAKHQTDAVYLAEGKLNDLIVEDMESPLDLKSLEGKKESAALLFNNKPSMYVLDFLVKKQNPPYYLVEVTSQLLWKEGQIEKGFSLTTYLAKDIFK